MKKQAIAVFVTAFALLGCQKGSVKGQVLDVFTKQPVTNAKVQVLNTPLTTTVAEDGTFEFKELDLGKHSVSSGKNKFSKSLVEFEISEKSPNEELKLYLFSKKGMAPGLYTATAKGPEKILNKWVGMDALCSGELVALKLNDVIEKTGKKVSLEEPATSSKNFELFYYQKGSNKSPITAIVSSAKVESSNKYSDKCKSTKNTKQLLVADLTQGKSYESEYASDNMVKVTGQLDGKRQIVSFKQSGKIISSYLLKGE